MITRQSLRYGVGIALSVLIAGVTTPAASGQTPLPGGFEMRLLPGYTFERLKAEDAFGGMIAKKGGPQIYYVTGRVNRGDAPVSGDYHNQALRVSEPDRLWLKEQNVAGRPFHIAYSKDRRLIVSYASAKIGVNLTAMVESHEDIADVLLMALTLAEQKPTPDR